MTFLIKFVSEARKCGFIPTVWTENRYCLFVFLDKNKAGVSVFIFVDANKMNMHELSENPVIDIWSNDIDVSTFIKTLEKYKSQFDQIVK
jgi:hypothetical protein